MRYRVALLGALVALSGLTGCRVFRNIGGSCHDVQPYEKAGSVASLKIPAGLDAPDNANALHIPALNTPSPPPRKRADPCLDEPPPFKVPKQAPPQT